LDILQDPPTLKDNNSIIMIMSPSCSICHEELEAILKKGVFKNKMSISFYAEALDKKEFLEFKNKYRKQIDIKPLYKQDVQAMREVIFPLFLKLDREGKITKVYR
ncbi:hypothetical protein WD019_10215, partial [Fictibacillus sp. Mic-4]|uniref:hypothetical protein n=1 Tax=Fictibacillus sp. Mic-4 TaxID=3132826 RepID=UPI003CE86598